MQTHTGTATCNRVACFTYNLGKHGRTIMDIGIALFGQDTPQIPAQRLNFKMALGALRELESFSGLEAKIFPSDPLY